MRALPPDVVFDHHEFSVAWRWVEKFGGLQASDVMILEATNPVIPKALTDIERELYRPALEKAIRAHGLAPHDYVTTGVNVSDKHVSLGGSGADIARNTFGLRGGVSYLIETRGVGIGLQSYQRRVATHYLLARAVLQTAAMHAAELEAAVEAGRAEAENGDDIVIAQTVARTTVRVPLIDAQTGKFRTLPVQMADTRVVSATERRARPAGYVVPPDRAAQIEKRLRLFGAETCRAREAFATPIERYDIIVPNSTSTGGRSIPSALWQSVSSRIT